MSYTYFKEELLHVTSISIGKSLGQNHEKTKKGVTSFLNLWHCSDKSLK